MAPRQPQIEAAAAERKVVTEKVAHSKVENVEPIETTASDMAEPDEDSKAIVRAQSEKGTSEPNAVGRALVEEG